MPSFFSVITVFASAGMFIKAGSKIKGKNTIQDTNTKEHKKLVKETDWFYSETAKGEEKLKISL